MRVEQLSNIDNCPTLARTPAASSDAIRLDMGCHFVQLLPVM